MRLTELRLTSFRSYSETVFNTAAPRVLVAGENGTGKSTLREAVRWLLTGHNGITDARGSGADLLAPEHSSLIQVEATLEPLGLVKRRRNNGIQEFAVGDAKGEPSLQQQVLYGRLKTTPAFLDAVLETEHFLRLHHADAKGLVLSLLDVKVVLDYEQCIMGGWCSKHGSDAPHRYDGSAGPLREELTLEQLDARYKAAFEDRKAAKVRLRAHTVPAKPAESFPPVVDIEAQIAKLRADLAVHQQDVGMLVGKRQTLEAALRGYADSSYASHPDVETLRSTIQTLEAEAATLRNAREVPQPALEDRPVNFVENAFILKNQREALMAFNPKDGCVLDAQIACPLQKRKVTGRIREIDIQLSAMPPADVAAQPITLTWAAVDGATSYDISTHKPDLRKMQIDHDLPILRERLAQAEGIEAREAERLREIAAIQTQIAALDTPDPEKVAAMEALQGRISKGEMVLKAAVAYWQTMERLEKEAAQHAAMEAVVARLEGVCESLGPNGARVQALEQAIGRFTEAINASLKPFGWTVRFDLDPWTVVVNQRQLQTYSESEQFRIGIAMQLAIAQVSGLSFAIIDRLDMLDAKNRSLATQMILSSPLEQVFILATREPTAPLPSGKGLLAYRLGKQGGRSVILEGVGA